MVSPLNAYRNATLVFTVPTGDTTTDGRGNPTAVTTQVTLLAQLKAVGGRGGEQQDLGMDRAAVRLKGRCTNPVQIPATVRAGMVGTCTVQTAAGTLEGTFRVLPVVQSPYTQVAAVLGEVIEGEFVQRSIPGEAL